MSNTANFDAGLTTILGIDPGYDRLGWAVAAHDQAQWQNINLGCITTDRSKSMTERYQQLESGLQKIIDQYQPTQAAVETLFFANNTTTALKVAEARGIILAVLMRNKITISQYNPMHIKETVTGNGRADKKAMKKMINLEFDLPPSEKKVLDDAIDALGAVLTHFILSKNKKFYA